MILTVSKAQKKFNAIFSKLENVGLYEDATPFDEIKQWEEEAKQDKLANRKRWFGSDGSEFIEHL